MSIRTATFPLTRISLTVFFSRIGKHVSAEYCVTATTQGLNPSEQLSSFLGLDRCSYEFFDGIRPVGVEIVINSDSISHSSLSHICYIQY